MKYNTFLGLMLAANLFLFAAVSFNGCIRPKTPAESTVAEPIKQAEKRILQQVEVAGQGMLKEVEVEEIEILDSLHVRYVYTFLNPMLEKRVKIERIYTFSDSDLDSITAKEDTRTWLFVEGEWVRM